MDLIDWLALCGVIYLLFEWKSQPPKATKGKPGKKLGAAIEKI